VEFGGDWTFGYIEDPKLLQYVSSAHGKGQASEEIGERLAQVAVGAFRDRAAYMEGRLTSWNLSDLYWGGPGLKADEAARLARAAIVLTGSSGEAQLTWPGDPKSEPNMDAVIKLVKRYPELAVILKVADVMADQGIETHDNRKNPIVLYRVLNVLNQELGTEAAGRDALFKNVLWADGDAYTMSFPNDPEYFGILAKGIVRTCTRNPQEQAKAIARFKQLAASRSWAELFHERIDTFAGPDEMVKLLGNPDFISAMLEAGGNNPPWQAPGFAAMLAAARARPDSEPMRRPGGELRSLIASRASKTADFARIEAEIRKESKALGGSEKDPVVGATSYYKTGAAHPAMSECALFRVVVKDAHRNIIAQKFLDEDSTAAPTFEAWRARLPKGAGFSLEGPILVTYAKRGYITNKPSPTDFGSR
jgi:hypothetical protein